MNCKVESVCQIYHNTLKKAKKIIDKEKMQDIEYHFNCTNTQDFMQRMGVLDVKQEWKDIFVASIEQACDFPVELDDRQENSILM